MKVVELLPFFNETDILQARIWLMTGFVARHYVVEAHRTHQGEPKPLHLYGQQLPDSVEAMFVDLTNSVGNDANWRRERIQRDFLARVGGQHLAPDDLLLSCDLDEIVMPYSLGRIYEATEQGPVSLGMRMIYYGNREDPRGWGSAKAFRAKDIPVSLSELRLTPCPLVPLVGWHLSYLGDTERRLRKVNAFAHAENRPGNPAWGRIHAGLDGPNGETLVDFDPNELPATLRDLVVTDIRP